MTDYIRSEASMSLDGVYRWSLTRQWAVGPKGIMPPQLGFVMLNPSTADSENDDPTIRRCVGFAKREGFGSIMVVNLYAMRATRPKHLRDIRDPEGWGNLHAWQSLPRHVVLAYGAGASSGLPASKANRWLQMEESGRALYCLGTTKEGYPRHPLYARADEPLLRWPSLKPAQLSIDLTGDHG